MAAGREGASTDAGQDATGRVQWRPLHRRTSHPVVGGKPDEISPARAARPVANILDRSLYGTYIDFGTTVAPSRYPGPSTESCNPQEQRDVHPARRAFEEGSGAHARRASATRPAIAGVDRT